MDEYLFKQVQDNTPDFNKSVANGLATEHMKEATKYIDRLFDCVKQRFPPGLVYEGSRVCTPIEQFREMTRDFGNSKRRANIARWDHYMMLYRFSYNGMPLKERYVLLPYVRPGGLMTLNGATYNVSPVLTDVGYSADRENVFIPLRGDKLTFQRMDYQFFINGVRGPSIFIIHSLIHKNIKRITNKDILHRDRINSTLAHYFFCRHGVTETFARYAEAEVKIGFLRDFPESQYPSSEYYRFHSSQLNTKHPTGALCLMVPKAHDSRLVRMLVGGFFYVVDTFPDRFYSPEDCDTVSLWKILLGHIIYGDYEHEGKMQINVDKHLASLDNYLDEITQEELKERNVVVNDLYELFHVVMTQLADCFYHTHVDETSLYNKRLSVLRYVLYDFNRAIFNFSFSFSPQDEKVYTHAELDKLLIKYFKPHTAVQYLSKKHGEINTVSYPGDNKMFRITAMIIPQDRSNKDSNYQNGLINDSTRLLHPSLAEICQYNNLPKNIPDGRGRINPHVKIDQNGVVQRDPAKKEKFDRAEMRMKRK